MDKDKIVEYIKNNKGVEIAALQQKFSLTYKQAKGLVDQLIQDGILSYESGVRYVYTPKVEENDDGDSIPTVDTLNRFDFESVANKKTGDDDWLLRFAPLRNDENDDDDEEEDDEEEDDEDNDDDGDDEEDDESDDGKDDADQFSRTIDEMRYKTLKLVIENGEADFTLIRDTLGLESIQMYKIFKWMEKQHYIDFGSWSDPRRIRITLTDLKNLYPEFYKADYGNAFKNFDEDENSLSEDEFIDAVAERVRRLICSDKRMGKQGALKKAQTWLEAVKDTNDRKMVQVYERLVFEIKNMSKSMYTNLKRQLND